MNSTFTSVHVHSSILPDITVMGNFSYNVY